MSNLGSAGPVHLKSELKKHQEKNPSSNFIKAVDPPVDLATIREAPLGISVNKDMLTLIRILDF